MKRDLVNIATTVATQIIPKRYLKLILLLELIELWREELGCCDYLSLLWNIVLLHTATSAPFQGAMDSKFNVLPKVSYGRYLQGVLD
jgi:hypothetical protein